MEMHGMSPSIIQNPNNDLSSAPIVGSIITAILNASPSCIEFSPLDPNIFVVGTYELDTTTAETDIEHESGNAQTQSRSGSLVLFRLQEDRLYVSYSIKQYLLRLAASYIYFNCLVPSNQCPDL